MLQKPRTSLKWFHHHDLACMVSVLQAKVLLPGIFGFPPPEVVTAPRGVIQSANNWFEVFYVDYGNEEIVTYTQLCPLDPSISSAPGIAQLCSLAFLKVPTLDKDNGHKAAMLLSDTTLNGSKEFRAVIEEKDTVRKKSQRPRNRERFRDRVTCIMILDGFFNKSGWILNCC